MTIDKQNFNINFDFDNNNTHKSKFIIEERRRLVAKLWAQSKSETEIARELHYNVSTICRDIKFLKKLSQQFVFDLKLLESKRQYPKRLKVFFDF